MLYPLHELNRALLRPTTYLAHVGACMFSTPGSWLARMPGSARIAAGYELIYRMGKDYPKPAFGIDSVLIDGGELDGLEVAVTERTVLSKPFCQLQHFERELDRPAPSSRRGRVNGSAARTLQRRARSSSGNASRIDASNGNSLSGNSSRVDASKIDASKIDAARIASKRDASRISSSPKVLVVAPLSGHHATLLRDTVRTLLPDHDVFITDWVDARLVPAAQGPFTLSNYVDYIREFIAVLGTEDLHVISVCQPCVPVLAAVSLMAMGGEPIPRTLTMMGGPIDARRNPTQVNDLATTKSLRWFESNVLHEVPACYPGRGRRVYPGFLQHTGFIAMNPGRHMGSHWDFYQHLVRGDLEDAAAHRRFYDEYNAVLDLPAEYYMDCIRIVFKQYLLPRGAWKIHGERVAPEALRDTALFTIEGELDDVSGLGQTQAAHGLCSGIPSERKRHLMVKGAGHYGIFSGRRWRERVYPEVREFIAAHRQ